MHRFDLNAHSHLNGLFEHSLRKNTLHIEFSESECFYNKRKAFHLACCIHKQTILMHLNFSYYSTDGEEKKMQQHEIERDEKDTIEMVET